MSNFQTVPIPRLILTNNPNVASFKADDVGIKFKSTFTSISEYEEYLRINNLIDNNTLYSLISKNLISFNFEMGESNDINIVIEFFEGDENFENLYFQQFLERIKRVSKVKTKEEKDKILSYDNYYLAFGVGDDLTYWSDFHVVTLVGASTFQDYSNPKTIQLTFSPSRGLQDFSWDNFKNVFYNPLLEKVSIEVTEKLIRKGRSLEESSFLLSKGLVMGVYELLLSKFFEIVFNTKNILIVLPRQIEDLLIPYTDRLIAQYFGAGDPGIGSRVSRKVEVALADIESFAPPKFSGISVVDSIVRTFSPAPPKGEVLSLLRALLSPLEAEASFRFPRVYNTKPEIDSEIREDFQIELTMRVPADEEDKKKAIYKKIESIKTHLKDLLGENKVEIILYRETDKEIINLVSKSLRFKKLDPDSPLVVFGDRKLIYNQIYADKYKLNYDIPYTAEKEKTEAYIESKLSKSLNLYKSQTIELPELQQFISQQDRNVLSDYTKYKNFPVFRFNTVNSNVLNIQVDDNKFYFSFLNLAYSVLYEYADQKSWVEDNKEKFKETKRKISSAEVLSRFKKYVNTSEYQEILRKNTPEVRESMIYSLIDFMSTLSPEEVNDFLKINEQFLIPTSDGFVRITGQDDKKDKISRRIEADRNRRDILNYYTDPSSSRLGKRDNFERIFNLTEFRESLRTYETWTLFDKAGEDTKGLLHQIEESFQLHPLMFLYNMLEFFDSAMFTVEIETLPFFPISNLFFLGKPCILIANRPPIVGSTKAQNPLDTLVSGAYLITGIAHEFNDSQAKSRFTLKKYPFVY